MAVGNSELGILHPVAGVEIAVVSAGIKKPGRKDVVLFRLAEGTKVAGVFTRNAFCAAPVVLSKQHLAKCMPRFLLVNTGNANAGTGKVGMEAAIACCNAVAEVGGVDSELVLPFSTGVIGEPLPVAKITVVLADALTCLSEDNWNAAASGIMTTDTRPKGASIQVVLGGKQITLTGIAKGSGMIKPNMATMLSYIATDLAVDQTTLQTLLSQSNEQSFNRITVDGDTSTNDCAILMATGKSGISFEMLSAPEQQRFVALLDELMLFLAQEIIRDGEGATKFVSVAVKGGATQQECLAVAYAIAESPLVKTALFASDPNWGRILACVGRAGVQNLDLDAITIQLDDVCIVEQGGKATSYTEALGQQVMSKDTIIINVNLNRGDYSETVYTCDFSYDYVKINAEYRS